LQAAGELLGIAAPDFQLLGVERRVHEVERLRLETVEEVSDPVRGRPHRLVEDEPAPAEHPGHVRQAAVGEVHGSVEVVDEDLPGDPDLVA